MGSKPIRRLRLRDVPGLFEAAGALFAIALGLRIVGFQRMRAVCEPSAVPGGRAEPVDREAAERVAWMVGGVAARVPLTLECLPRALAVGLMLRRRRIPFRLCLGVAPAEAETRAHAWIEVEGKPVGEGAGALDPFAPLS